MRVTPPGLEPASWSTMSRANRQRWWQTGSSRWGAGRWPTQRPFAIRVNGVCPLAWTRLVARSPAAQSRCTRERTPDQVAPLVTYLLSDLAAGITGQLIRCTGDQLHIVRQPAIKEPVLRCAGWDTEDVAAAFDEVLDQSLEPFGLEKRLPPRLGAAICCPTE